MYSSMANRPNPGDPSSLSRPPGEVNNFIEPGAAAAAARPIDNLIAIDEDFKYQYEKGGQYFMGTIVQGMLINNKLIYDAEFIHDMKHCDWNPDNLDWHNIIAKWEGIIAERRNPAAAHAVGGRRKKRTARKRRATKSRKRCATKSRKHRR